MSIQDEIQKINARAGRPTASAAPATAAAEAEARPGALQPAFEDAGRFTRCYRIDNLFGIGNRPIAAIGIRVLTKNEEDGAVSAAQGYAARVAKDAGEGREAAAKDPDLLGDAKLVEALWRACREVKDPADLSKGVGSIHAFPGGPEWMRAHLTTDQLAMLFALYAETRRAMFPERWDLGDERIEALATMAANHVGDDVPEAVLAPYAREHLTHAFVLVAQKLTEARTSVEVLIGEVEARDARILALEAELAALRAPAALPSPP